MPPPSWLTALCRPAAPIPTSSCCSSAPARSPTRSFAALPGGRSRPGRGARRRARRRHGRPGRARRRSADLDRCGDAGARRRAGPTPWSRPGPAVPRSPPRSWAPGRLHRRPPPGARRDPARRRRPAGAARRGRGRAGPPGRPGPARGARAPATPGSPPASTHPRVGLLSVGAEPGKGDKPRRAADAALRLHPLPDAVYVGPVEGHDVVTGARADVVVTDGFTGNVLLKGIEAALAAVPNAFPPHRGAAGGGAARRGRHSRGLPRRRQRRRARLGLASRAARARALVRAAPRQRGGSRGAECVAPRPRSSDERGARWPHRRARETLVRSQRLDRRLRRMTPAGSPDCHSGGRARASSASSPSCSSGR